jgi:hypothetical protein
MAPLLGTDRVWTKSSGWGLGQIPANCSCDSPFTFKYQLTKQGWSVMGSVAAALLLAKILSDTVKYYDHFGFMNVKTGVAIAFGTFLAR